MIIGISVFLIFFHDIAWRMFFSFFKMAALQGIYSAQAMPFVDFLNRECSGESQPDDGCHEGEGRSGKGEDP